MNGRLFVEVFVTLVVIVDPPGTVPIFLTVTRQLEPRERHRAALLASLTAFAVIGAFGVAGRQVLDYLHVTIPAMQGAGGLLLLLVALELLTGNEAEVAEADPSQRTSIAMVPLGTPLLAGPGAIVAVIVFVSDNTEWTDRTAIALGVVAVVACVFLALRYSGVLMRVLRPTGVLLMSRIAGILLAAIAVQMMATSLLAFADQA